MCCFVNQEKLHCVNNLTFSRKCAIIVRKVPQTRGFRLDGRSRTTNGSWGLCLRAVAPAEWGAGQVSGIPMDSSLGLENAEAWF
jgi:hypothetical protein